MTLVSGGPAARAVGRRLGAVMDAIRFPAACLPNLPLMTRADSNAANTALSIAGGMRLAVAVAEAEAEAEAEAGVLLFGTGALATPSGLLTDLALRETYGRQAGVEGRIYNATFGPRRGARNPRHV